jgi:hypothetical protein
VAVHQHLQMNRWRHAVQPLGPPSAVRSFSIGGLALLSLLVTGTPRLELDVQSAGAADGGGPSHKRSLVWKDTLKEDIDEFSGANLFVSHCRTERGRKLVLLEPLTQQGMLIEEEAGSVVNSAELTMSAYGVSYVEVQGGIASNQRMNRLVSEMMNLPFNWFEATKLSTIPNAQPDRPCAPETAVE